MRTRTIVFFGIGAILAACSGPQRKQALPMGKRPQGQQPPSRERAKVVPPSGLRLGDAVQPTRYALHLTLDPNTDRFRGEVKISLRLARPTSVVWLHGRELDIDGATLIAGGRSHVARAIKGPRDVVGFVVDRPVDAGIALLTIRYRGKVSASDKGGIFRRREVDRWYILTQFEPIDARRAFPCFDEPRFKVPLQLSLTVPSAQMALANAPASSVRSDGRGHKTVTFVETPPLPSYLVAFAVGPFDAVDAGKVGKTPVRIIVPRGRRGDAVYAAKTTPKVLRLLESYFGRPYPYAKLDQIAVPGVFGAMENPGLITYRQSLLLSHGGRDTIRRRRAFAGTCAHELAHIWFGDLVTMRWWDDLWLNEAFATWMTGKILHRLEPGWNMPVRGVRVRDWAMRSDSLQSARRIRQPIRSAHDIRNAFDGITYSKGASVLTMFESWIGERYFREGVRRYMGKHAWKNATAADFLAALETPGRRDVKSAFATFLDQNGVPLVSVSLQCERGKRPRVLLEQRRYLPLGSKGSVDRRWQIPICVAYGVGKTRSRACTLLVKDRADLELGGVARCPEWLVANDQMAGYYRVRYADVSLLERTILQRARTELHERVGMIADVRAALVGGDLSLGRALSWLPRLLRERNRHIVSATATFVSGLHQYLVSARQREQYARFVRQLYGRRAHALGLVPRRGDDEDTRLLRGRLIRLVGGKGEDRQLIREAGKLARRWLTHRQAIDPELLQSVLHVAGKGGDQALYRRLYDQARETKDRKDRNDLLRAMSAFVDPKLVTRNLKMVLSGDFEVDEAMTLVMGALWQPRARGQAYRYIKQNFKTLVAKMPRFFSASMLASAAGAFCDEAHLADARKFFSSRAGSVPGGPRMLAQGLERARLCIAQKKAHQAAVAAFLSRGH